LGGEQDNELFHEILASNTTIQKKNSFDIIATPQNDPTQFVKSKMQPQTLLGNNATFQKSEFAESLG
jgi:hypothetical protein